MKTELVRFGVAMERGLLEELDAIVQARGGTRSEVLRDLARAEVVRSRVEKGVPAVAAMTLVYNHHVRDLTEKLTEIQHALGDQVRSSMHIHLDADRCLEVIIMRGRSDELRAISDRLLATRGVTHGGIEIVAESPAAPHDHEGDHDHRHPHEHAHPHPHGHPHPSAPPPAPSKGAKKGKTNR
jgi:CopG family nickel-responsive transcriptional regulator